VHDGYSKWLENVVSSQRVDSLVYFLLFCMPLSEVLVT